MTKAEAMFDKLGYKVQEPLGQSQCQIHSKSVHSKCRKGSIIDINIEKWRYEDGTYQNLTKDEIEACIQVIREMGEKYEN